MISEQTKFNALLIEEREKGFVRSIVTRTVSDLPENDLLIRVRYSSLNYKDALSANGNKGVTKKYPHTPGIDAVGTVIHSNTRKFREGEKVIITGYDLGMNTAGGFGQYIRVPSEWVVKLPEKMSMKESMIIGTAGLTAGISIFRLIENIKPEHGKIIISGATGGVGSLSVAILAKLGFTVSAITGKEQEHDYLINLGANDIISRKDFEQVNSHPLMKSSFAGGIDTVGGGILENIIKSIQPLGVVTCCGNVASPELNLTVFPFILRGISLIGIDSQNYPMAFREVVWRKLATDWKPDILLNVYKMISLAELSDEIDLMLQGQGKGRTVLDLEA
jgi:putative YhdH/YhfP family quinone oxidoreductase